MTIVDEMKKLRKYLDDHNIHWREVSHDTPDWWICRTHFEYKGFNWSVVNGYGTYGGIVPGTEINHNKLELMVECVDDNEPIGWLTAEDVIGYIEAVN